MAHWQSWECFLIIFIILSASLIEVKASNWFKKWVNIFVTINWFTNNSIGLSIKSLYIVTLKKEIDHVCCLYICYLLYILLVKYIINLIYCVNIVSIYFFELYHYGMYIFCIWMIKLFIYWIYICIWYL